MVACDVAPVVLMSGLLAPLAAGAAVILPKEGRFAAGTFWRDAVQHRATFYTAVPTMHQILLARAGVLSRYGPPQRVQAQPMQARQFVKAATPALIPWRIALMAMSRNDCLSSSSAQCHDALSIKLCSYECR